MIPFKSKLTRYKNIKNRNAKFHSLTEKQKAREIAYDALKLIMEKKIRSAGLCTHYWGNDLHRMASSVETPEQLQAILVKVPKCTVCARGATMLSTIRLGNKVSPDHYYRDMGSPSIVQGLTYQDLRCMEEEYENDKYGHPYDRDSNEKLANIFCNVIKNGRFNTGDRTDYLVKWKVKVPKLTYDQKYNS